LVTAQKATHLEDSIIASAQRAEHIEKSVIALRDAIKSRGGIVESPIPEEGPSPKHPIGQLPPGEPKNNQKP
jgi:hypothetical protein